MHGSYDRFRKQAVANGEAGHLNLDALVQKSETAKSTSNVAGEGLADEEIYDNLFISALPDMRQREHASLLNLPLVALPGWHEWIAEEVRTDRLWG